jgi:hypothetical protein
MVSRRGWVSSIAKDVVRSRFGRIRDQVGTVDAANLVATALPTSLLSVVSRHSRYRCVAAALQLHSLLEDRYKATIQRC